MTLSTALPAGTSSMILRGCRSMAQTGGIGRAGYRVIAGFLVGTWLFLRPNPVRGREAVVGDVNEENCGTITPILIMPKS